MDISEESLSTKETKWTQYGSFALTTRHRQILESRQQWLDDSIVSAVQNILKQQFPLVEGLQTTVLGESLGMNPQPGEFVQIVCVRGNHWVCVSTVGCPPSTIKVYDSLHGDLDAHTKKLVADLMQSKQQHINVCYANVQRQSGTNNCGLCAIAFATSLCFGEDPTTVNFWQER